MVVCHNFAHCNRTGHMSVGHALYIMNSWCYLTLIVLVSLPNFVSKATHANIPTTEVLYMGIVKLIWNLYNAICYFNLGGKDINTHARMHAHTE